MPMHFLVTLFVSKRSFSSGLNTSKPREETEELSGLVNQDLLMEVHLAQGKVTFSFDCCDSFLYP